MPAIGIHLIPDYYSEIYVGAPPYQVRTIKQPADGFADSLQTFLLFQILRQQGRILIRMEALQERLSSGGVPAAANVPPPWHWG